VSHGREAVGYLSYPKVRSPHILPARRAPNEALERTVRLRVRYDTRADIHEAFLLARVRADLLRSLCKTLKTAEPVRCWF
jgi:hypothetical protein